MSGAKKYLNGSTWDDIAKQYYYENISTGEYIWIEESKSINEKMSLVGEYNLGGCAFWALDQETSDFWKSIGK
jgi:spore germination protein YaaH